MSKLYALLTVVFLIAAVPGLRAGEPAAMEVSAEPVTMGTEAGPPCATPERPGCFRRGGPITLTWGSIQRPEPFAP